MSGNWFLRTSVVFLVLGVTLGMYMGMSHDFTHFPAHAHLNLVGGVIMFLAGLYYNAHPQVSKKAILAHYILATVGVIVFVPGIAASTLQLPWAPPVVGIGSLLAYVSIVFFAVMVFLGTQKPKTA